MNSPEGYTFVCAVRDIPRRGKKTVRLGETTVLIVACDSGLYAVEDRCPQTARSIAHGKVLDGTIVCPTTGAEYDLRTGRYLGGGLSPLQSHWLTVFPLVVVGSEIYIRMPKSQSAPTA